ncbi:MAG: GNAT family N-acetyltransferase [Chloroflexi bacterium]|nr:MAG: GNAT family N-acetyltransferase [Chloroflexota bacterium]
MFKFLKPDNLSDGYLSLVLEKTTPANPVKGLVPAYTFWITRLGQDAPVGSIQLRIGHTENVEKYGGHIGYEIFPLFRGHRYAARGCKLILLLARQHKMKTVWITCDPDNIASRRTCEIIGAKLIEVIDVPHGHELYRSGSRQKCRYRLDLKSF